MEYIYWCIYVCFLMTDIIKFCILNDNTDKRYKMSNSLLRNKGTWKR